MPHTEAGLWKTTLGQTSGPHETEIERLRVAYGRFRDGVRMLAADIAHDLPTFTVHDITHIDALWDVADTIAGPKYPLNPLEAFVLGGAFLVHDLGMGLASWPGRESGLQKHPLWRDTVTSLLQRSLHRAPTSSEVSTPPRHVASQAISELLRQLHAEHAERLVDARWRDLDGTEHVLLEDEPLRFHLGPLVGRIAHSHWWDTARLFDEFSTETGAPTGFPKDWVINSLKIAALLRVTDAAHLDDRRAPRLLRAARGIDGLARQHWVFQGHLTQVREKAGQLVFTATRAFGFEEADSWWLASETLQMVDRELHAARGLLATRGIPPFAAQSVAGVESPSQLVRFLPVNGWEPVQAHVRVGDVAGLIERIGGTELYGHQPTVPLRELIQNAADAVVARRVLEGREQEWGSVVVRVGKDENGPWLEVADDGVGMSRALLTGALLDFGESYWGSALCREEHRNLVADGFEPTGRYGIGFFSVFMWGERVRVTSRPYAEAQASTRVLEFRTGLRTNPVLRAATASEYLRDGGTVVRVWLKTAPEEAGGLLHVRHGRGPEDLGRLCARLAPALSVDLHVEENGVSRSVIKARDWETLSGVALLERLCVVDDCKERRGWFETLGTRIRPIKDEHGRLVGRACITHITESPFFQGHREVAPSTVTVGGLSAGRLQHFAGILQGRPCRADRMTGMPVITGSALAEWATQQAPLLTEAIEDSGVLCQLVEVVNYLGGDTTGLPIGYASSGWLTEMQIAETFAQVEAVTLLRYVALSLKTDRGRAPVNLIAGVLAVDTGRPSFVFDNRQYPSWPRAEDPPPKDAHYFHWLSPVAIVVRALSRAWGVPEVSVWKSAEFSTNDRKVMRVIGHQSGVKILENVDIIHRPPQQKI